MAKALYPQPTDRPSVTSTIPVNATYPQDEPCSESILSCDEDSTLDAFPRTTESIDVMAAHLDGDRAEQEIGKKVRAFRINKRDNYKTKAGNPVKNKWLHA